MLTSTARIPSFRLLEIPVFVSFQGIAAEHEQAAQRLGRSLANLGRCVLQDSVFVDLRRFSSVSG